MNSKAISLSDLRPGTSNWCYDKQRTKLYIDLSFQLVHELLDFAFDVEEVLGAVFVHLAGIFVEKSELKFLNIKIQAL